MEAALRRPPLSLEDELYEDIHSFEFLQAVRVLQRLNPGVIFGDNSDPRLDPVRIQSHVDFGIYPSEIQKIIPGEKGLPPTMVINFLSIAGVQGPLPDVYAELLIERIKVHDYNWRDFLDIFNHRLAALWFKFYTLLYPGLKDAPLEKTVIGQCLMDLSGARYTQDEEALLPFSPLLWHRNQSIIGLEELLSRFFSVPCKIHMLEGGWDTIPEDERTSLGKKFHVLGESAILGHKSYDQGQGFRIILGPMGYKNFMDFMPKGSLQKHLHRIICSYFDTMPCYTVELLLKGKEIPKLALSAGFFLGRNTWLKQSTNVLNNGTVHYTSASLSSL